MGRVIHVIRRLRAGENRCLRNRKLPIAFGWLHMAASLLLNAKRALAKEKTPAPDPAHKGRGSVWGH